VNGSLDAPSQDLASGSSRKGSSRKRLPDEVEDSVRDSQEEVPFSSGWSPHALLCCREISLSERLSLVVGFMEFIPVFHFTIRRFSLTL